MFALFVPQRNLYLLQYHVVCTKNILDRFCFYCIVFICALSLSLSHDINLLIRVMQDIIQCDFLAKNDLFIFVHNLTDMGILCRGSAFPILGFYEVTQCLPKLTNFLQIQCHFMGLRLCRVHFNTCLMIESSKLPVWASLSRKTCS